MLTDKPLNTIFNAETSKEAWDSLMAHYKGKGEQKIAYLIIELFCSTLSDDMPLDPQINAMLHTANTITTLGLPLHEKLIALAIIISLPLSYDTLKTILTAAKSTEMTVKNVHSQVALEEHWRTREADSSSAFTAHFKGTPKGKNQDLKLRFQRKSILYTRFGLGILMHNVVTFFGAKFPQPVESSCMSSLATILVTVVVVTVV